MLGLIVGGTLSLYRIGTHGPEPFATVQGDADAIALAFETARAVEALALACGGWSESERLAINAHKPGNSRQVSPEILDQNTLNSGLGELQIARALDCPGPVRVDIGRGRRGSLPGNSGNR